MDTASLKAVFQRMHPISVVVRGHEYLARRLDLDESLDHGALLHEHVE